MSVHSTKTQGRNFVSPKSWGLWLLAAVLCFSFLAPPTLQAQSLGRALMMEALRDYWKARRAFAKEGPQAFINHYVASLRSSDRRALLMALQKIKSLPEARIQDGKMIFWQAEQEWTVDFTDYREQEIEINGQSVRLDWRRSMEWNARVISEALQDKVSLLNWLIPKLYALAIVTGALIGFLVGLVAQFLWGAYKEKKNKKESQFRAEGARPEQRRTHAGNPSTPTVAATPTYADPAPDEASPSTSVTPDSVENPPPASKDSRSLDLARDSGGEETEEDEFLKNLPPPPKIDDLEPVNKKDGEVSDNETEAINGDARKALVDAFCEKTQDGIVPGGLSSSLILANTPSSAGALKEAVLEKLSSSSGSLGFRLFIDKFTDLDSANADLYLAVNNYERNLTADEKSQLKVYLSKQLKVAFANSPNYKFRLGSSPMLSVQQSNGRSSVSLGDQALCEI